MNDVTTLLVYASIDYDIITAEEFSVKLSVHTMFILLDIIAMISRTHKRLPIFLS
jgi:hypothetical protein